MDVLYRAAWALSGSRPNANDLVQEIYVNVLARHLSVPEATVTTRLYRGRRHVAQTLIDDLNTPNPIKVAW